MNNTGSTLRILFFAVGLSQTACPILPPSDLEALPEGPAQASSVTMSPSTQVLAYGTVVQLYAAVYDGGGAAMGSAQVSWSSNNTSVASVDGSGVVTAGWVTGDATIQACVVGREEICGSALVTVLPAIPSYVSMTPGAPPPLEYGASVQLAAMLYDANNNAITALPLTWSSTSEAASVSASGLVTAGSTVGSCTVYACEARTGVCGSVFVQVVPPANQPYSVTVMPWSYGLVFGGTVQLNARAYNYEGTELFPSFVWSTSDDLVATVTQSGLVTAGITAGGATITACVSGGTPCNAASVQVSAPIQYFSSIVVSGDGSPLVLGATRQLQVAITYDDASTSSDVTRVAWYSGNSGVVDVSSGLLTPVAPGTTYVYAIGNPGEVTSNLFSVTVAPEGIIVECDAAALVGGEATNCHGYAQLAGGGRGGALGGVVFDVTAGQGLISGIQDTVVSSAQGGDGTATIRGSYTIGTSTLTATASLEVVTIGSISISAASGTLLAGSSRDVTPLLARPGGAAVPASIAARVDWSVGAPLVLARTPAQGASTTLSVLAVGQSTLTASFGFGLTSQATITTTPAAVEINPSAPAAMAPGVEATLTVRLFDNAARTLALHASAVVNWSSTDGAVAGLTPSGLGSALLQAAGAGSADVSVTVNGVSSPSVRVDVVNALPGRAGSLLYVMNGRAYYVNAAVYPVGAGIDLGPVILGSGSAEYTGPRFLFDAANAVNGVTGIGRSAGGAQMLYERDSTGGLTELTTLPSVLDTAPRGVAEPGSAAAFGLAALNHDLIAYTTDGAGTTANVTLRLISRTTLASCTIPATNVERATPTSDGGVAFIWFDNLYLFMPSGAPTPGQSCPGSFEPITSSGGLSGSLLFGRRGSGGEHTIVTVRPNGASLAVSLYDLAGARPVTPVTSSINSTLTALAGGFVLSEASLFDGDIVVQHWLSPTAVELHAIDVVAGTITPITPPSYGAPIIDTNR